MSNPPRLLTRLSPKICKFRFSFDMVKDDWPPLDCWPESHLKFVSSDLAWTWWKMIDPPRLLTRLSPKICKFRFSFDMVKDDWPPLDCWPESHLKFVSSDLAWTWWTMSNPPRLLTRLSPKICKFRFSFDMVKDDWPPLDCWPESHLKFVSSDLAWTWWTMSNPPRLLTRLSPKICKFRFSFDMVKDDWPPLDCWPESHLKFVSSDLAWTWWKMSNPPRLLTRLSPKICKFRFSFDMVKDDWPPLDCWPESHLKFVSSDLAWTCWKMIDPPKIADQTLT